MKMDNLVFKLNPTCIFDLIPSIRLVARMTKQTYVRLDTSDLTWKTTLNNVVIADVIRNHHYHRCPLDYGNSWKFA